MDEASDWAVAEVGMARGRSVTLRPSMLPLFTRDSISSERSSVDSRSTWIILQGAAFRRFHFPNGPHWNVGMSFSWHYHNNVKNGTEELIK